MNEAKKHLAEQLRFFRKQKGLSQEELAEQTGLSNAFISALERAVANPTLDTLERLSAGLQIPISMLLDTTDTVKKDETIRKIIIDNVTKMEAEQLKIMLSLTRLTGVK